MSSEAFVQWRQAVTARARRVPLRVDGWDTLDVLCVLSICVVDVSLAGCYDDLSICFVEASGHGTRKARSYTGGRGGVRWMCCAF